MRPIQLLDQNTIDQIAAGEVVDRPASIVKELMENAIDAGADSISVEIRGGGISLIRVTDNGCGIPKEQIALAFLRHSTSKIRSADDLSFIHTLGFRGEALSSIAAVSQTELCTKTRDSLTGVIYKINGGAEASVQDAGLPNGTTIIVRDLFYNTPARLKFLKSEQTEAGYITDLMQRIALSRPDIAFKYTVNGSLRLSTSGNGSLKDAIYAVFGRDITNNLLEVDVSNETVQVSGFLGKPEIARGNRNFEFFFVNGRYIRDKVLQKALEDAYIGYQMKGTFPFAVLNLTLEPELIDVNVHPSKMEIRFFNNETVFYAVYDILRDRITKRESIPSFTFGQSPRDPRSDTSLNSEKKNASYVPEPFERHTKAEYQETPETHHPGILKEPETYTITASSHDDEQYETNPAEGPHATDTSENVGVQLTLADAELTDPETGEILPAQPFLSDLARPGHRIIGELFRTYWIVEYEEKLYIIDQHAAHEKVLYERFMNRIHNEVHYAQNIIPAIVVTLSTQEEATLAKYEETFRQLGFEFSHFGGSEYAIHAVPTDLYSVDNGVLFLEMLDDLSQLPVGQGAEILTDRVATAACKAAVKGGDQLSLTQANALIEELLGLENPYNCPHGRPTIISMTKTELEKKFKRII